MLGTLGLIDDLATNSIKNSNAALRSPLSDAGVKARATATLVRLVPKRRKLRTLIARSQAGIPTKKSCMRLAARLGVDPSKLNR